MPSKTVARSGNRTSRSKASSRSGARPARKPAAQRRPAARQRQSRLAATAVMCGRAARTSWLMLARGVGGTARSVGRAHDIDAGHRRDGMALALLALAVVVAASSWFTAARPVGAWIDTGVRTVIGSAVVLMPLVAVVIAVILMRSVANPDARPRLVLGATMVTLPVLGLWHLWAGSPQTPDGRRLAAGFVGFAAGGPLSDGVTPFIAAPLLVLAALFGVLLLSGTTIRE
ncbi:MAG TPA: cell division protein FtsK, partial [Mycobacterium sp.]|nr:cell division protein FtsK [Mycobacterium sp.]